MSELIHLRCSSLPLAFRCPGSTRRAKVPVNESHAAADGGTAAHEGHAIMVRTGKVDWDAVAELAKKHGVDEQELRVLLALGLQLWEKLKESFPHASAEVPLKHQIGSVLLTGHPDVLAASGMTLRILDWKDGRLDTNYREQLLGYCALGLLTTPGATSAESGIGWVRDGEYEAHTMDRAGLYAWMQRIEDEIVQWDGVYRPGAHCHYCPRSHECQAANALARRDFAIVADRDLPGRIEDAPTLREMIQREPEKVVELLERADLAAKVADRVRAAIKEEVLRAGDIVGGGKRLTLQRKERRHLNVLQAFPILQDKLEDAEMAEVIDISLAKAEDLVGKKAGKGNGAKAKRELQAELAQAGAIETSQTVSLIVRRETPALAKTEPAEPAESTQTTEREAS